MFTAIRKDKPTYLVEEFDGSEQSANNLTTSFIAIKSVDYDEIDRCAWLEPGGYIGENDFVMLSPEGNVVVITAKQFDEAFIQI